MATQPRLNLSGRKFVRWTVLGFFRHPTGKGFVWQVKCDCGNESRLEATKLLSGKSRSCGCLASDEMAIRKTKHGLYGTQIYRTLRGMITRCHDPNNKDYHHYGGRGIRVCDEWRNNPQAFADHVGPRPSKGHSIDRINDNGNYEPGNVKWSTLVEQNNNKRTNRMLTFRGETLTLTQMANKHGLPGEVVNSRIRSGWSIERTLTEKLYTNYHNENKVH